MKDVFIKDTTEKRNGFKIGFIMVVILFISYLIFHLGWWYAQSRDQKAFYERGSITEDAYNYYLLIKCLKEDSVAELK